MPSVPTINHIPVVATYDHGTNKILISHKVHDMAFCSTKYGIRINRITAGLAPFLARTLKTNISWWVSHYTHQTLNYWFHFGLSKGQPMRTSHLSHVPLITQKS